MALIQSILVLEPWLIDQNDFKKNQSIRIWYQKYRLPLKKMQFILHMSVPRGLKILNLSENVCLCTTSL